VGFVDGIVQDVSGELAFVLFEVGEDLLGEFFSGGGQRSFAGEIPPCGTGFLDGYLSARAWVGAATRFTVLPLTVALAVTTTSCGAGFFGTGSLPALG
jgi:hypothetical protein